MQGEAPKPALLDTFRRTPNAVLLATASFWQGVDVVGDQLSCVDHRQAALRVARGPGGGARIDRLRNRGGNAFGRLPGARRRAHAEAGLGRLIRSAADRGILAVLDSRCVAQLRPPLPGQPAPARLVHDLRDVRTFFGGEATLAEPRARPTVGERPARRLPAGGDLQGGAGRRRRRRPVRPWKFQIGDDPAFAQPTFDDSGWEEIRVPGGWGVQGHPGVSGVAWYRATVDASGSLGSEDALGVTLGNIDSAYELFAGGRRLGGVGGLPPRARPEYDRHATYIVPAETIAQDGKLVLALRVWKAPYTTRWGGASWRGRTASGRCRR
jgi:hypothetical protein